MIKKALVGLIKVYQKYISPLKRPACRYFPSCSEYAAQAISIHGPLTGLVLAIWRILRCNPFSAGGYDPVPSKRQILRRPVEEVSR
jgi:putative membrane protein insertion efficiency factor